MKAARAILVAALLLVAASASAFLGFGWDEVSTPDLPWLGSGERAREFRKTRTVFMSPTGSRTERRWGRSAWSGQEPYVLGLRAARFLEKEGVLSAWPESRRSGTTFDGTRNIRARVAPYAFTIVALQPTIVVMRFDLGAVAGHLPEPENWVQNALLENRLRVATTIEGPGSLSWFSPELRQPPTPLRRISEREFAIDAGDRTLTLRAQNQGDAPIRWQVEAPR